MLEKHIKVFLDANIIIRAGKPPGGPLLVRLMDLVDADFISVFTTDITLHEVANKHAENDYRFIKEVGRPHFRKLVKNHLGTELPNITKNDLKQRLVDKYRRSTEEMFENLRCRNLSIDDVKPSVVFSAYAANEGFFSPECKKDQFPDAFIFECLKATATLGQPLIIVSDDGDFDKPSENEGSISLVKSLPELFEALGLKVDAPAVEEFLTLNEQELIHAIDVELANWGLIGDIEDSEVEEATVTSLEDIEITSFGSIDRAGPILVIGRVSVDANVCFTHPNWDEAMYDSEDRRLIPFSNVSGEMQIDLELDLSMLLAVNDQGEPHRIMELTFRNDDFQYIELTLDDGYPWK